MSRLREQLLTRSKEAGRKKLRKLGLKPLGLAADEAAAYWGLSTTQFLSEVAANNIPGPIGGLRCKRKLWSRLALKNAMKGRDAGMTVAIDNDPLMAEIKRRAPKEVA